MEEKLHEFVVVCLLLLKGALTENYGLQLCPPLLAVVDEIENRIEQSAPFLLCKYQLEIWINKGQLSLAAKFKRNENIALNPCRSPKKLSHDRRRGGGQSIQHALRSIFQFGQREAAKSYNSELFVFKKPTNCNRCFCRENEGN